MDAYHSVTLNSLIPAKNSLFLEIFSLLICVGSWAKATAAQRFLATKSAERAPK
jgi:hypothetical protein